MAAHICALVYIMGFMEENTKKGRLGRKEKARMESANSETLKFVVPVVRQKAGI